MREPIRLSLLIFAAMILSATSAAAQSPVGLPDGVTPNMVAKGDSIYHHGGLCFACHGPDAKGTAVCPNLTDDVWLHIKGTYPEIVAQVTKGTPKEESKSGNVMPPKGGSSLSEDDVKAVAAYVYTLSHPAK